MEKNLENITPVNQTNNAQSTTLAGPVKPLDLESDVPTANYFKKNKMFLSLLGTFLIVVLLLVITIGFPLFKIYTDAREAYKLAQSIKTAAKQQDIKKTTDAIVATKNQVAKVKQDLQMISWTQIIPFFGAYTSDAIHITSAATYGLEAGEILTVAIEPYADLLGFKGQGTFVGGNAEDRIAKTVETLEKVTPQIDKVAQKMELVQKEINTIDPNRYPQSLNGIQIRSRLKEFIALVDLGGSLMTQARPMVKKLPDLLGSKQEKKYMILFQNDKEIRPTGGFITAYAIFRVDKGRIHLNTSDDIYKLDDTLTKHIAPPDPISRYLNVYGWRLRDSNFSPDFNSSMRTFDDLYATSRNKESLDGIIAVDTHLLIKMMEILGPIQAYGTNFTTQIVPACDCPMVIYELEKYADEPKNYERGSRKDIIGVLLSEILKKALSSPKQIYAQLFQVGMEQAKQKHFLIYLKDSQAQLGVEALGFAGRIKSNPGGDYLHINDANLGGAKANLFLKQSVKKDTTIVGNSAQTTLTIEYRYPRSADNCSLERKSGLCLAGIYRDFLRVYLPENTSVTEIRGFENKGQVGEDLGHTVVSGFFTVVPEGLAKIQIKYKTSNVVSSEGKYHLMLQKQPGTEANRYAIIVNGQEHKLELNEDKELTIEI